MLGLPILAFGVFGLFQVMPDPQGFLVKPEGGGLSPDGTKFMLTLWDSGFAMLTVCITHALAGALVLVNRYVPLALAIHLPVSLQMTLFHIVLDPKTGPAAFMILALNMFLIWVHRESYRRLLVAKAPVNV